jgi:sugar phosphate isomerase/epimerase
MERFPFAFSTSWNFRDSRVGRELMERILGLGFSSVELNYRIHEDTLSTILPMVERGEIEVSSVHNVFPAVDDGRFDTDSRLLGYEDEELRRRAVDLGKRSVDYAAMLGAGAVVVHPGAIPMDGGGLAGPSGLAGAAYDAELKRLRDVEGPDSAALAALRAEFAEYRRRALGADLRRVVESLRDIAEYAAARRPGVRLGVENRPMCHQIPDFAEMRVILDELAGLPVGPWFDTGHGALMRKLGFFDDRAEAAALSGSLVGVHIHDVRGTDDHFAPYEGDGLDDYLGIIEAAPIRVLELGKKNSAEDVVRGAAALASRLAAYRAGRALPGGPDAAAPAGAGEEATR